MKAALLLLLVLSAQEPNQTVLLFPAPNSGHQTVELHGRLERTETGYTFTTSTAPVIGKNYKVPTVSALEEGYVLLFEPNSVSTIAPREMVTVEYLDGKLVDLDHFAQEAANSHWDFFLRVASVLVCVAVGCWGSSWLLGKRKQSSLVNEG